MAINEWSRKIDENRIGNVIRPQGRSHFVPMPMATSFRPILILIMTIVSVRLPNVIAQTTPQLELTLIGQTGVEYVTPAGETSLLKLEVLNFLPSDIYLLRGDAYLDPNLNGDWQLAHSESLGSFHLTYLQSAIWSFELAVPARIQAANSTNGMPQVVLQLKVTYTTAVGSQHEQRGAFTLGVPGATVQESSNVILLELSIVALILCVCAIYVVSRRRRRS